MNMKPNRQHLIVGRNSASYNDKHPENPIVLRPIRDALRRNKDDIKMQERILSLSNESRPNIISALKWIGA